VQPEQGHLEFVKDGVNSWFVNYDAPEEAKAKLTTIVNGGLSAAALATRLPELEVTGRRFRTADFAREFEEAVIQPAREVREKQLARGALVEGAIRLLAFVAWLVSWLVLRVLNRTIYALSKEPTFEILGKLGGAVETKNKPEKRLIRKSLDLASKTIRNLVPLASKPPEATPMPRPEPPTHVGAQDMDFASHFRSAKGNPWIAKVPRMRRQKTM
jgi:hypothetical protein